MDFETQHVLHLLINRLQSGEYPISSENGVVDFPLLSALTGNTEGWVGLLCQELLEAFQYSENDVRSAVHLEKTATILIAWSAALRVKQNKQLEIMDLLQSIPNGTNQDLITNSENNKNKQKTDDKIFKIPASADVVHLEDSNSVNAILQQEDEKIHHYIEENLENIEEDLENTENIKEDLENIEDSIFFEKQCPQKNSTHINDMNINTVEDNTVDPIEHVHSDLESANRKKSNVVYVKVPNIRSTLRGILRFPDIQSSSGIDSQISEQDFTSIEKLRQIDGLEVYVPCLYRSYSILDVMIVPSPYEESVQQPIVEGISEYSMNDSLQNILANFRRSAK